MKRAPDRSGALKLMGMVLHETGRVADALEIYRQTSTRDPADPMILGNIAACLCELGRHDEAVATCELALALKPDLVVSTAPPEAAQPASNRA